MKKRPPHQTSWKHPGPVPCRWLHKWAIGQAPQAPAPMWATRGPKLAGWGGSGGRGGTKGPPHARRASCQGCMGQPPQNTSQCPQVVGNAQFGLGGAWGAALGHGGRKKPHAQTRPPFTPSCMAMHEGCQPLASCVASFVASLAASAIQYPFEIYGSAKHNNSCLRLWCQCIHCTNITTISICTIPPAARPSLHTNHQWL